MKDVKFFFGIVTIFVLMSMLISCDVFDRDGSGILGGDLNSDGRLVDAILGSDATSDPKPEDIPNPKENLSFMPERGSKPPTSKFIFFPTDYIEGPNPFIYVVIPKLMTNASLDELYLLGEPAVLNEIKTKVYPNNNNIKIGNTKMMGNQKTITMLPADSDLTSNVPNAPADCFYIKIPAELKKFTKPDWIQGDPTQSLFRGFRMEFVNRAEPDNWDDCRISFVNIKKRASSVMPYTKDEFFADPYANQNDDYGNWFQIRLNYENRKKYHVPPPK